MADHLSGRTSAISSRDGFLSRDLDQVPAVKVAYGDAKDAGGGHAEQESFILTPVGHDESGLRHGDIEGSRWNTRGWTLQERCLSTRSLHFCRNKMYFECLTTLRSEEHEPEQSKLRAWSRPPAKSRELAERLRTEKEKVTWHLSKHPTWLSETCTENLAPDTSAYRQAWYDYWKGVVIQYSRRRLTMDGDKQIAIQSIGSSVAAHVADALHPWGVMWCYCRLAEELLWYVESGIPRRLKNDAPSFSWASLQAPISFVKGSRTGPVPNFLSHGPEFAWGNGFLSVKTVAREVCKIYEMDDDAASFSYELLDEEETVFALGQLDYQNRDNTVLSIGERPILYAHLRNNQHPSGLLVQLTTRSGARWSDEKDRPAWLASSMEFTRIGVATLFEVAGPLLDEAGSSKFRLGDFKLQ
jgi:hypothetical protein